MKNKKGYFSLALTVILTLSLITSVFAFSDVSGHWAETTIRSWIAQDFIKGYEDGTFKPNNNITRAEFATLVNKAFGFTKLGNISFTDVSPAKWYYNEVAKGVEAGYITGFDGNMFKPEENITREQVAVIITKLLNLSEAPSAANGFSDASQLTWSKGFVGAATLKGILRGYPEDGSFKPRANTTRAESVIAMDATLNIYKETTKPDPKPEIPESENNNTVSGSVNITKANYGPSTGLKRITGNVDVTYNGSVATIKNLVIEKNLYISKDVKNIIFENVVVDGNVYINGGTKVSFKDSDIKELEISSSKSVEVVSSGATIIDKTIVKSAADIRETDNSDKGFKTVILDATLSSKEEIVLSGQFYEVKAIRKNVVARLTKGTIDNLLIDKEATNTKIEIEDRTTIKVATVNSEGSTIKGKGTIREATINANHVTLQKKPDVLKGSYAPYYVDGNEKYETEITVINGKKAPIKGAKVYVDNYNYKVTGEDGKVKINLEPGSHNLEVVHDDFKKHIDTFSTSGTHRRTVNMNHYKRYELWFNVHDRTNNIMVDGATITLTGLDTSPAYVYESDSNGEVYFNDVEAGVYTYNVTKQGHSSASGTFVVERNETRDVYITNNDVLKGKANFNIVGGNSTPGTSIVTINIGGNTITVTGESVKEFRDIPYGTHTWTATIDDSLHQFNSSGGNTGTVTIDATTKTVTINIKE